MLKVLLKKQFSEMFRSYFYDPKKNRMRSKGAIAGYFAFFIFLIVGVFGGMFTILSTNLCSPLVQAGLGWFYFLIMGGLAIVMGAFGSVFTTYSELYLAKDNDLLLSMPIPVRLIIASRLINVYIMGTIYSAVVLIPALIVYWVTAGATFSRIICGILFLVIITSLVLLLSCILGWVVAKISLRLKNKSFITVVISLLFFALYYFVYFKSAGLIRNIIENAAAYGNKIQGTWILYMFGSIGEGSWIGTVIFLAAAAIIFALVWIVISRSFLSIATAGGVTRKVRYVEKDVREKSVFNALLGKEFSRLAASPNYMLNCALGTFLIPVLGIVILIMGPGIMEAIGSVFEAIPDMAAMIAVTFLCLLAAMNDMATPSLSMEGKSIWIPKSLPVKPQQVIRAKTAVQFILTELPVLFGVVCVAIVIRADIAVRVMMCLMPLAFTAFLSVYDMTIGVKMPFLNWTSENILIKQSSSILLVLFSGWGFSIVPGILYLAIGRLIGAAVYLAIWTVIFAVLAFVLLRWLDKKGSRIFEAL